MGATLTPIRREAVGTVIKSAQIQTRGEMERSSESSTVGERGNQLLIDLTLAATYTDAQIKSEIQPITSDRNSTKGSNEDKSSHNRLKTRAELGEERKVTFQKEKTAFSPFNSGIVRDQSENGTDTHVSDNEKSNPF